MRSIVHRLARYYRRRKTKSFISKVFNQFKYTVHSGPFKGMKYIKKSFSSSLLPKLLGIYERELHDVIGEIISTDYKNIVDIGSAEGYYAIGFAYASRNRPQTHIYAYDTNRDALQNLKKLAALNNVSERVRMGAYCGYADLELFKDQRTLIFCDIEGDELVLLDPAKAPSLLQYDLLVEIHDAGKEAGIIKTELTRRFKHTHRIELIHFTGRSIQDADAITCTIDRGLKQMAVNEGRKKGLEWMWLKRPY